MQPVSQAPPTVDLVPGWWVSWLLPPRGSVASPPLRHLLPRRSPLPDLLCLCPCQPPRHPHCPRPCSRGADGRHVGGHGAENPDASTHTTHGKRGHSVACGLMRRAVPAPGKKGKGTEVRRTCDAPWASSMAEPLAGGGTLTGPGYSQSGLPSAAMATRSSFSRSFQCRAWAAATAGCLARNDRSSGFLSIHLGHRHRERCT
jgi:hypothetical protein